MLIIGAKGFAKELLEVCRLNNILENLCFYDDLSTDTPDKLFREFPVLRNEKEAKSYFKEYHNEFTIGIGNPYLRENMFNKFTKWGGGNYLYY